MIDRYSRPEMKALWSEEAKYRLWLEVETAALEGMVKAGLAPEGALAAVRAKGGFSVERIEAIEREVKHDVIAFLTSVAEHVGEEARYLHFGMTSSDLLDTALSIQLCRATDMILAGVDRLLEACKHQAIRHKLTVCIGRSHGIHAEPTTFGLKVAGWYAEIERQRDRIRYAREEIAVGAISGPVGTYAHLTPAVEEHVCAVFKLKPAAVSTQVISRDVHNALFLSFAELATTIERIAVEIRHLQRTEVREVEESFTKGQKGSSAMPHKRNPILTENLTGLARMIRAWAHATFENIPLWHERDISHSSVERFVAPDITVTLDFMIHRATSVVRDLVVSERSMQRNLDLTGGLVFSGSVLVALADKGLSREEAYQIVQSHALAAWDELEQGVAVRPFRQRVAEDPRVSARLSPEELAALFSLERHLRNVDHIFKRVFRS